MNQMLTENINIKPIHRAARIFSLYSTLIKFLEIQKTKIEKNLMVILNSQLIPGLSIESGRKYCKPSWKDEFESLCKRMDLNVEEEVAKIKERVGNNVEEKDQVKVDSSLQLSNDFVMQILNYATNSVKE